MLEAALEIEDSETQVQKMITDVLAEVAAIDPLPFHVKNDA